MKQNFVREIERLLQKVPASVWKDHSIRGLMYEFLPWHGMSSLAVQASEDDPHDPASWKSYDCADSDGSRILAEMDLYRGKRDRLVYHRLLVEAAEALLSIDFAQYGQPKAVDGFCLYKPFLLQVYDAD